MSSQESGAFTTKRAVAAYLAGGVFLTILLLLLGVEGQWLLVFAVPYFTIGCVLIARLRANFNGQTPLDARNHEKRASHNGAEDFNPGRPTAKD